MRRLFVVLISVPLLLAFLPSAALAGKPTFEIRGVTVTSLGYDSGGCDVEVKVLFKEARGATGDVIKIQQSYNGTVAAAHTVNVSDASRYRGSLLVTNSFYGLTIWQATWHWGAFIEDYPPYPLTTTALTSTYTGSGTAGTCPAIGTVLATYTPA